LPPTSNSTLPERRTGILSGAAAYLIWGLFPLYFHRLKAIRPFELASLRIVLTSLAVWMLLVFRRDTRWFRPLLKDRRRLLLVAAAGLMVTTNWLIYVWAAANGHVIDAAIGYFINPLISVALGVFVLKERMRPAQKAALVLGFVAVCVLTIAYGQIPWVALSLAISFGLYGYLKKITGLDGVRALAAETFTVLPLGVVGLLFISTRANGLDLARVPTSTMLIALTAGVVTAFPLTLFGVAATRIPLALLGLLQYITPVGQLLCGVFAFHEKVSAARWAGIALVCLALVTLAADLMRDLRSTRPLAAA
jgi:chloramphenicol-sensitive protein RarD